MVKFVKLLICFNFISLTVLLAHFGSIVLIVQHYNCKFIAICVSAFWVLAQKLATTVKNSTDISVISAAFCVSVGSCNPRIF